MAELRSGYGWTGVTADRHGGGYSHLILKDIREALFSMVRAAEHEPQELEVVDEDDFADPDYEPTESDADSDESDDDKEVAVMSYFDDPGNFAETFGLPGNFAQIPWDCSNNLCCHCDCNCRLVGPLVQHVSLVLVCAIQERETQRRCS